MGVDAGKAGGYAAGLLFGVGWWLFIDGVASAAFRDSQIPFGFLSYLPGVVSTLAFFMCVARSSSYRYASVCTLTPPPQHAGSTRSTGRW